MWCSTDRMEGPHAYPRHWVSPARLICLECEPDPDNFGEWLMFCDDPRCYTVALPNSGFPPHVCAHDSDHDFLKIRTTVHPVEWGLLCRRAVDALERRVWGAFRDPPLHSGHGEEVADGEPSEEAQTDQSSTDQPSALDDDAPVDGAVCEYDPLDLTHVSCMVCAEEVFMGRCWYCLDCAGTCTVLSC